MSSSFDPKNIRSNSSSSFFEPKQIKTNSKIKMVEVDEGTYLQGKELEEFCLKRGKCTICAKVKVRRKVVKVFGSNTWEPITVVKTQRNSIIEQSGKLGGIRGKKNRKIKYDNVKTKIESGDDEELEYLVYKGFCLNDGCYTLDQAKRLSGCSKKGISGGRLTSKTKSSDSSITSMGSRSIGSRSQNSNKRGGVFSSGFRRKASTNNPFLSPKRNDRYPLLKDGEDSKQSNKLSPLSSVAVPSPTTSPSAEIPPTNAGENSSAVKHDNHGTVENSTSANTANESEIVQSPVVPSPQVRRLFEHEFSLGDSPNKKERYRSSNLYSINSGSNDSEDKDKLYSKKPEPIRLIVQKTISALQGFSSTPVIHTLDLTGLRVRRSEMEALAKLFKTGKNGTVHLTTLILSKCGIGDELMRILGQALYDALWTANNTIDANAFPAKTKISTSMRHARMRLKSLCIGGNEIGNDGVDSLSRYLESISCELEKLDLSHNRIETVGGLTIFNSFLRNPQTRIESINLSSNFLRELDSIRPDGEIYYSPTSRPGQVYGARGFLSKNRTLKELDLSANGMSDNGVEALCGGLFLAEDKSALEKLNLGSNCIGDRGADAISKCLFVNQSLAIIQLNDNEIENTGALSLLSGVQSNTTLRDISGLWSNAIEKRNICVSIRQLLVDTDREKIIKNPNIHNLNDDKGRDDGSEVDIYLTTDSESTIQTRNGNGIKLDEDMNPSNIQNTLEESDENFSDLSVSDRTGGELSDSYEDLLRDDLDENKLPAVDGMMETNQEVTHNLFDRMTIMNSSPLVCFDDKENGTLKGIPLQDTRSESEAIKAAVITHHLTTGSKIEVREEMATLENFKAFFSRRDSSALHLSCHQVDNSIALENGYGSLETLPLVSLKELISIVRDTLRLVFVSSIDALRIGRIFRDAGIPHVVCCRREDKFRDSLATDFMESFYEHIAQQKNLREAFQIAIQTVVSLPISKYRSPIAKRFHLLSSSSDVPVFFQSFVPTVRHNNAMIEIQQQWNRIPPLLDNFVGREIEIYKVLASLQIYDSVEVSGHPGCGKQFVVAASLEYALTRRETFSIDQVCWIPAPKQAMVDPDSLYGDLVLCCDLIRDSSEDQWDKSELILDCRERLAVALEGTKVIIVIDNRSFTSKNSRAALEKLVNFIVMYASSAKVVCITATKEAEESEYSAIKTSHIEIGTLSFLSTALLFGDVSEYVSPSNVTAAVRSAKEFSEVADAPFICHMAEISDIGGSTRRRADVFQRMGNGLPADVIAAARGLSRNDFDELMKVISKPEICVESLNDLESEVQRWKNCRDIAMKDRNYKRAVDLQVTIDELDGMRLEFCSLKDLKAKEKAMKLDLADAVSNRRYDVANELKRGLLMLKKKIMKERRVPPNRSTENPNVLLNGLKAQVNSLADTIENHETTLMSEEEIASFEVNGDGHICTFLIYSGSVFDPKSSPEISSDPSREESKGIVCWSNEACGLEDNLDGKLLLDLQVGQFKESIDKLPILEETRHGPVRCMMGNSIVIHDVSPMSADISSREEIVPVLTVGPFLSPSGQVDALMERDVEYHRSGLATLRSCYRSCMRETNKAKLHALVIRPLTTRTHNGPIYEETLRIAMRIMTDEAKFSRQLHEVHIVGKSAKEASLLVEVMKGMGYSVRQKIEQ